MDDPRVREQLNRILASRAFMGSDRATRFLRFVVERALDGRGHEIKESVVAIEVLGRSSSFDSRTDPIVRVEAARLRDRLRDYYAVEGSGDDVLISIPKGGYAPEFRERQEKNLLGTRLDFLRLSILPPADAVLDSVAISPDGRSIAFTASLRSQIQLWVRDMDSLDAKPLPGTEGAGLPFWSPDSRWIGYFTPAKLKVCSIAGGPARDVADVVVGKGGAWNREGVLVFGPRPLGVLHVIPIEGGTPRPVTSLDPARAEYAHGFPQFLPDGRRFLYLALSHRPGESSVRVGSLDSTESKVVVSANSGVAFAPVFAGRRNVLLYVAHGALMAQPLDPESAELRGEPQKVAPAVRYRRWREASMTVSNNGILIYLAGSNKDHQFGWINRDGSPLNALAEPNELASDRYTSFTLSPDERRVAIHRHNDPDTPQSTIWLMDLFRNSAVSRFSDVGSPAPEFCPVWSPDASELVFSRGDDRGMRLFRQAVTGGAAGCILDTPGPKFPTDWSSDGNFVAFNSQAPDFRSMHTWIVPTRADVSDARRGPFLLHSHSEGSARFFPARPGEAPLWVAYTSDETGRHEIYVRDFPGGAHKWQISITGGVLPQWRRDGRELYYLAPDGALMAVSVNPEPELGFGTPQKLFLTGLQSRIYDIWMNQYAASNDGTRFLFNCPVADRAPASMTVLISRNEQEI